MSFMVTHLAGFGAASGVGGIDANTKLLLHCDVVGTTFTDSAPSPHTMTRRGDAQISAAQSKFGGASYLGDGTGDAVDTPDSTDWDFPGDFTIDFWLRFTALPGAGNVASLVTQYTGGAGVDGFLVQFRQDAPNNRLAFLTNDVEKGASSAWTPSTGVWYHIACVRSSGNIQFYVDGATQGSSFALANDLSGNASPLVIGALLLTGSYIQSLNGHMDEVRISNVARWTAPFTPPGEAYS
jgi:hypothetical protein